MIMRAHLIYLVFFQSFVSLHSSDLSSFTAVDRWYEVYLDDAKVGYVHDEMSVVGDKVKSRNEFVMQIKRAGQSIEITVEQETNEKLSGELVDFSSETKMAGIPMIKKGWWKVRNWSFMKSSSLRTRKPDILLIRKEL